MEPPRMLLISAEPLAARMTGPAIRTYELGRALTGHAEVVLACPRGDGPPRALDLPVVTFRRADPRPLAGELARASVVVAQPPWPHVAAAIRRSRARFVADLYDPEPFELLETLAGRPRGLRRVVDTLTLDRILAALHDADHVMCASEKQRDLWLGTMLAQRLLSAQRYDADPSLRSIIDVIPFGVPSEPARRKGAGPRRGDEEIVLWNGGIWNWLDAPTAIRAVAELVPRRPRLRLLFMGASARGQAEQATAEARALAAELGLLGSAVEFNTDWVPYEERADWLLDADCAISTHREHLETRFAFRTRLLDCIWAGLPMVCTRGDELAERVERDGLGATVAPGDHLAAAQALEAVLARGREAYAPALERAREQLAWERAAAPLVRWVTATGAVPADSGPRARADLGRRARDLGLRAALRATGRRWWPSP
jgi:glycosyltransferase involved in cell wall biosynthesis